MGGNIMLMRQCMMIIRCATKTEAPRCHTILAGDSALSVSRYGREQRQVGVNNEQYQGRGRTAATATAPSGRPICPTGSRGRGRAGSRWHGRPALITADSARSGERGKVRGRLNPLNRGSGCFPAAHGNNPSDRFAKRASSAGLYAMCKSCAAACINLHQCKIVTGGVCKSVPFNFICCDVIIN